MCPYLVHLLLPVNLTNFEGIRNLNELQTIKHCLLRVQIVDSKEIISLVPTSMIQWGKIDIRSMLQIFEIGGVFYVQGVDKCDQIISWL